MALFSFLKRKEPARRDAASPSSPEAIQQARTQARRRLIGAALLVLVGVIGFPLLFETTPRPIPVDIPIEIPTRQGAAPLALPPARGQVAQAPVAEPVPAASASARQRPLPPVINERADEQGREVTPDRASTSASAAPAVAQAPPPKAKPAVDDGNRAKALLDGAQAKAEPRAEAKPAVKPPPKPEAKPEPRQEPKTDTKPTATADASQAGRFVVQVGAFGEASSASAARQKLEKLGVKTYTQEVEVNGQRRIRVRVGPFDNRADAEKAAARIKGGGLPAALLTL